MGFENQGSRSGNYVGGFLQIFDWNAKSRKKLFSSKSDAPGRSKQKKRCDGNLPTTRIQKMEVDEIIGGASSIKEGSDYSYSCCSSVMDEDFYETRAPSVVARLMGLDSMPLSDSQSLPTLNYYNHHQPQKSETFQDGITNSGSLPVQNARVIEKFQTEVLPPKYAKSISVTHHKLLSPIKSGYFNPSTDGTRVMEAATRIIEFEPNKKVKSRKPPSRIFEGSQRKGEVKNLKGPENKKGKSISLALQAKANIQKREDMNVKKKEICELSPSNSNNNTNSIIFISQLAARKHIAKKPSCQNGPNVLRQNNQKQNCIVDRGKSPVKSTPKVVKSKLSGTSRVSSSKKTGSEVKDDKNKAERVAQKKRCVDGNSKAVGWNQEDRRKTGTNVVSFTFTAPIKGCHSKSLYIGNNNIKGGDALSSLLEEKLKELAQKVEFSEHKSDLEGNQAVDEMDIDNQDLLEELSITDSNTSRATKSLDCRFPSPVSVLDLSPSAERFNSSDTADSNSMGVSKQCSSSIQSSHELLDDMYSSKMFLASEADAELTDSASSNSIATIVKTQVPTLNSTNHHVMSQKWELEYVKEILFKVELMFEDFAVGRSQGVIKPHLFDKLEMSKGYLSKSGHVSTVERKLLFDCVGECLDFRCRPYGCKSWVKNASVIKRKERLAGEVCKEISGWSPVGDSMIDELVDKNMSSQHGKWLDFDVEAFELGLQLETRVLNSLIDELVAYMLQTKSTNDDANGHPSKWTKLRPKNPNQKLTNKWSDASAPEPLPNG
ncbi:phosphatidylinositolN-acetyglucosaminlytransferase subunit P-related [Striga asiatica]|uniref:PhosphatidylinositolN-acetyglucosaminlytransferase subunit P-related n=1 Tax=Striga asiatica TaxID=4170 RepID=A0A5A7P053_STRAF|nr:phosphatidylinositolN-acetyglucosaminlytransferase subunit P-related [Striga asiatica]